MVANADQAADGPERESSDERVHDVVVIGAGITGLLALHKLRRAGFDVQVVEAGSAVGGTWWWNRYPGCRFDSESYTYDYFLSELLPEWEWSEHFAGQPEIETYLNWAVDKLALRENIRFDTRIKTARYDSAANLWEVSGEDGYRARCQTLVTAIGVLSVPQYPAVEGRDTFLGPWFHTALWPQEPVDFAGKRVGVIGTSSSGVQVSSSIASEVSELYVFQRTPQWCAPLNNSPITAEEQGRIKAEINQIHETCMSSFGGFVHLFEPHNTFDVDAESRRAFYEKIWGGRGFSKLLGNYQDILVSQEANDEFCAFIAEKIRGRVNDPAVAEKLIPIDHGYGVRRPPFETGYFEIYNRDNVTLVDLRETPLEQITERGVKTTAAEYELDIIVYATGFDAITGAFDAIEFIGEDGKSLKEVWADGPRTYMGVQTPGFPNLFFMAGAHGIGGNVPRASEIHVDLVTGCLEHMRAHGYTRVEPSPEGEREWTAHVHESANASLARVGKDWSFGVNTPGKKPVFRHYAGGLITYVTRAAAVVANGYEGFVFSPKDAVDAGDVAADDRPSEFVGSTLHALASHVAKKEGKSGVINVS